MPRFAKAGLTWLLAFTGTAALLAASAPIAHAQESVPNDACTTAGLFRQSSGAVATNGGHFLFCNGSNWIGFLEYRSNGNLYLATTGAVALPDGTTGQRPSPAIEGMIRFNTTLNTFEGYVDDGTPAWEDLLGGGGGGAINDLSDAATNYTSGSMYLGQGSGATATGTENTALGDAAMSSLTTGVENVAIGHDAMTSATNNAGNTAIGNSSLCAAGWATCGEYNVAVGRNTLFANSASNNTAIGANALYSNADGWSNVAIGRDAMYDNADGEQNVGIGENALYTNVDGAQTTAVGFEAMRYANNSGTPFTTFNTALGAYALRGSATAANNTGIRNTAIGHSALLAYTSGANNTAVGAFALNNSQSSSYNTAVGAGALESNVSNGANTALGYRAANGTTSSGNTAIGTEALYAGGGDFNTVIGYQAGDSITTGSSNIIIGYNIDAPSATASNQLNIGNTIYGNLSTAQISVGTATPGARIHSNVTSTAGNTVLEALRLSHEDTNSGGAVNMGASMSFNLETATNATFAEAGRIETLWTDATAASKDSVMRFYTMGQDTAGATPTESMRLNRWGPSLPFDSNVTFNSWYGAAGTNTYIATDSAFGISHSAAQDQLNIWAAPSGTAGTTASPMNAISVGSNADVGIGINNGGAVTAPAAKFHVMRTSTAGNTALEAIRIQHEDSDSAGGNGIGTYLSMVGESNSNAVFPEIARIEGVMDDAANASKDSNLRFYTLGPNAGAGSNTATEKMRLDSTGQLGIGNFTADTIDSALHLVGTNSYLRFDDTAGNEAGCIRFDDTTTNQLQFSHDCATSWTALGGGGGGAINDLTDAATNYSSDNMFLGTGVGVLATGTGNTGLGSGALAALTSSIDNVAIGHAALLNIEDGAGLNTAIGTQTLYDLVDGQSNTAIGHYANRLGNSSGNTAIGRSALYEGGGDNNIAIGFDALHDATTGAENVVIGATALANSVDGDGNIAIGWQAGDNMTTGDNNIIIGHDIDTVSATGSNQLNIGNTIYGDMASDFVGIGNTGPNVALDVTGDIEYTGTIADVSDRRLKKDIQNLMTGQLDKVLKLQGVSFKMIEDAAGRTELGLIAQDVQKVFPELVQESSGGTLSLNYTGLIAPMIEAMKEQQAEIDELRTMNAVLISRIEKLEAASANP